MQNDNKVLVNASKILLLSIFLIKLLDQYKQPHYRVQSSAQTDYENSVRQKKFLEFKAQLRVKFLSIFKYLHESHLIFCKMILRKVQVNSGENNWVI